MLVFTFASMQTEVLGSETVKVVYSFGYSLSTLMGSERKKQFNLPYLGIPHFHWTKNEYFLF